MKLKPLAIEAFARYSIGSALFNDAIRITTALKDKELSGTEKKAQAFQALEQIAATLGAFAVNFAIELAVAWLKSKALIK
jgi:hypothetical protein